MPIKMLIKRLHASFPLAWVAMGVFLFAQPAQSREFDFWESTYLVDVRQGSGLSSFVRGFGSGGFETARGASVSFKEWYSADWTDFHVGFVTLLSPSLGITWTLGTGEQGQKYVISPSLKLGFVYRYPMARKMSLSFSGAHIFGGELVESPCIADYGQIGGVQKVNCRMAAGFLPPEETLKYLANEKPYDQTRLFVNYEMVF